MQRVRRLLVAAGFLAALLWPAIVARADDDVEAAGDDSEVVDETAAVGSSDGAVLVEEATAEATVDVRADGGDPSADAREGTLDAVFGDVDIDQTEGGPDFDIPAPGDDTFAAAIGASMSGTRDGTAAVLYHVNLATDEPETWVWAGTDQSWRQSPGANQPGGRFFQAAAGLPADDPAAGLALLYGGLGPSSVFADTWVLGSGYQWHQACDPCAPSGLAFASAANSLTYTLLFGGTDPEAVPGSEAFSDTLWLWDGAFGDWTPVPTVGPSPGGRLGAGFTFDGRDFLLFGGATGYDGDLEDTVGDTWRLTRDDNGDWRWELVCTVCGPGSRAYAALAGLYRVDDPRPGAIMIGGVELTDSAYILSDQWAWDGSGWVQSEAGVGKIDIDGSPTSLQRSGVPYAPKSASLPALGAIVWSAGYWNGVGYDRVTEQITLVPIPIAEASAATLDTADVAALPFTGRTVLPVVVLGIGLFLAGALVAWAPATLARRTALR